MSVRFAPSPTGAFHLGNFRTAWISWQWAQVLSMPWVVRFEDIDRSRVIAGAKDRQLAELGELGLVPDLVTMQSLRFSRHLEVFERAKREGQIYPCICSRQEVLSALASAPHRPESLYSGRCRNTPPSLGKARTLAWRFRTADESGGHDFIVARTDPDQDFTPSYHWACALDDMEEGHQLLVRAFDLEAATPLQRQIQKWLSPHRQLPAVFHSSLVVNAEGHRLEKRTQGVTWPELQKKGLSSSQFLQRLSQHFQINGSDFAPAKIWGESEKTRTLQSLGF